MKDIYQHIFEFTPDALLVVDAQGRITLTNEKTGTLFGYGRNELIGLPVEVLIPHRFAARHVERRQRFMQETESRPMGASAHLCALHKDGHEFPVDIMLSPMQAAGQPLVLCVVRDITERRAAEDTLLRQTAELRKLHTELKEQADRDSLTGLLNRRAFHELAEQLLKSARRRRESVTLMMVDLDHFKRVNDQFGHAEGDHVLKLTAAALMMTARGDDIVARHGGEEFVVASMGSSETESLAAAERLREAVAGISQAKSRITTSIGVATYTPNTERLDPPRILARLLEQADRALYAAKDQGRNQVCHFNRLPLSANAPEAPLDVE